MMVVERGWEMMVVERGWVEVNLGRHGGPREAEAGVARGDRDPNIRLADREVMLRHGARKMGARIRRKGYSSNRR